jgi:aspartyl-tRNA(Asn)/glutamyl-tRNA(Gln) amidotransferase subunit C
VELSQESKANGLDVRYVADLARIQLTADEVARFETELDDILEYVQKLAELDVDGIEPTAHAMSLSNVIREDVPRPSMDREAMLKNAPATAEDAFVRVPVVIEDEGVS